MLRFLAAISRVCWAAGFWGNGLLFLYVEYSLLRDNFARIINPLLHLEVIGVLLSLPLFWVLLALTLLGHFTRNACLRKLEPAAGLDTVDAASLGAGQKVLIEDVLWDSENAAYSYFILQVLRDVRLPPVVHFMPEDYVYDSFLSECLGRSCLPREEQGETSIRPPDAENWVARCFPLSQDLVIAMLKANVVLAHHKRKANFMKSVQERYAVEFQPDMGLPEKRPGYAYYVENGYEVFYHYWGYTDQAEDEAGFRERVMSEAIWYQFPDDELISWWRTVIASLLQHGHMTFRPRFGLIPEEVAEESMRFLTSHCD